MNLVYSEYDFERMVKELRKESDVRKDFEIDRDRIIHSSAFRRLQGKTQVYGAGLMDFYRTRLTHSIEVAQISKAIGLRLGIDTDVLEAISLAHDIGHPPFGHTGEDVLNCLLSDYGGFEANAHNIVILTFLENKVEDKGLNLTRTTLDGLLKYKKSRESDPRKFIYSEDEWYMERINWIDKNWKLGNRSIECQIVNWSDNVAYSVHDLEDGIKAKIIRVECLNDVLFEKVYEVVSSKNEKFSKEDVEKEFNWVIENLSLITKEISEIEKKKKIRAMTSKLINDFVVNTGLKVLDDRRGRYSFLLEVPDEVLLRNLVLKGIERFLVYENRSILKIREKCSMIVRKLFQVFSDKNGKRFLPQEYQEYWDMFEADTNEGNRFRIVSWYIAGMTDNYAIRVYKEFFDPNTLIDIFAIV